jgi:hypothetical protein
MSAFDEFALLYGSIQVLARIADSLASHTIGYILMVI